MWGFFSPNIPDQTLIIPSGGHREREGDMGTVLGRDDPRRPPKWGTVQVSEQKSHIGSRLRAVSGLNCFCVFTLIIPSSALPIGASLGRPETPIDRSPAPPRCIFTVQWPPLHYLFAIKIIHEPLQKCALLCVGLAFEKFGVVAVLLRPRICGRALSLSRPCGLCALG